MSFIDAYYYSDVVLAELFEGIPQPFAWSNHSIELMKLTQKYGLTRSLTDEARKLMISRLFEQPLKEIIKLSSHNSDENLGWGPNPWLEIPKYRIYSVHDFQIANMLSQIDPTYNYTYIPYAAKFQFELYQTLNLQLFFVKTYYDGKPIHFKECKDDENPDMCLTGWVQHMRTTLHLEEDEQLKERCDKPYPIDKIQD